MTKYAAFLRGIGPGDPRMANDKLRGVFEFLGFTNVQTVISSGNVMFESEIKIAAELEKMIEAALPERLGFSRAVFVRSQEELRKMVDGRPFDDAEHSPSTNLNITFVRRPHELPWKLPHKNDGYIIKSAREREIFSVVDTLNNKAPALMRQLDKTFGNENTTRTLLTVQRILRKWEK